MVRISHSGSSVVPWEARQQTDALDLETTTAPGQLALFGSLVRSYFGHVKLSYLKINTRVATQPRKATCARIGAPFPVSGLHHATCDRTGMYKRRCTAWRGDAGQASPPITSAVRGSRDRDASSAFSQHPRARQHPLGGAGHRSPRGALRTACKTAAAARSPPPPLAGGPRRSR